MVLIDLVLICNVLWWSVSILNDFSRFAVVVVWRPSSMIFADLAWIFDLNGSASIPNDFSRVGFDLQHLVWFGTDSHWFLLIWYRFSMFCGVLPNGKATFFQDPSLLSAIAWHVPTGQAAVLPPQRASRDNRRRTCIWNYSMFYSRPRFSHTYCIRCKETSSKRNWLTFFKTQFKCLLNSSSRKQFDAFGFLRNIEEALVCIHWWSFGFEIFLSPWSHRIEVENRDVEKLLRQNAKVTKNCIIPSTVRIHKPRKQL